MRLIGHNPIPTIGIIQIAESLKLNTSLNQLNLSKYIYSICTMEIECAGINDDGAVAIANAIKNHSSLTDLDLGIYIKYISCKYRR